MNDRKVAPRACDPASPRVAKIPPPTMPPIPIEKALTTPDVAVLRRGQLGASTFPAFVSM